MEIANRYAALYIRVSTDEQAEQGFSIDAQKERLEAYCKSQGWSDFRFYIDDGYTGTNVDRPALERMIRHIQEGKIHTAVVYRLDRLSRKQKDVLYLLEDVFEKYDTHFKSSTEPFDTSTPLGKAMLGILAVFAQLEHATIVERTTEGRRKRIREGMWFGGRIPFGYDWIKETQQLMINHEQAAIVREIFQMYLRGASRMHIAEVMNEKTNERNFSHTTIRDMLARPIYAGFLPTHDGTLVDGRHEPIIDLDLFARAQEETRRRGNKKPFVDESRPFLSGLLVCGECGAQMYKYPMRQTRKGKEYVYNYYACVNQHVRPKDRTVPKCSNGYKRDEKLEAKITDYIMQYKFEPEKMQKEFDRLRGPKEDSAALLKQMNNKLKEIESKLERWYSAFESDLLDPREFKSRIDPLQTEKQMLLERIDEIQDQEEEIVDTSEKHKILTALFETWDEMTTIEKRSALSMLIDSVVVDQDWTLHINWAV